MTRKEKELKVLEAFGLKIGDKVKINSDTPTAVFRGNIFVITERTDGAIVLYQKIEDRIYYNITLKVNFLLNENWEKLDPSIKDKECKDFLPTCVGCPIFRSVIACGFIKDCENKTMEQIYNESEEGFKRIKQEIFGEEEENGNNYKEN